MNTCTQCGQYVSHRNGWTEYGERDGFAYRGSALKHDSDTCAASPTGFHVPSTGDSWQLRPFDRWPNLVEWAREVFTRGEDDATFHHVPVGFRRAWTRLYSCYPSLPSGICDPLYMSNVIANELGIGDGMSNFTIPDSRLSTEQRKEG